MNIIMLNIYTGTVTINDLGTQFESGESIDMLENYTRNEILQSDDLETEYNNGYLKFTIDGNDSSLVQVIKAITGLTETEHENLDTLKHRLSEQSFFQVEKNLDGDVERIVYYTDGTLTTKIREDEIIRDQEGIVTQLIKRQYDSNDNVVVTETQTINRVNGDVVSIGEITT